MVIEQNVSTMRVLEPISIKLQSMSPDEATRFKLGDSLGGIIIF